MSLPFSWRLVNYQEAGLLLKWSAFRVSEKAVSCLGLCSLCLDFSVQVAKYLTTQFYSLNYSLRQRMDILDVSALLLTSHLPCVSCTSAVSLRCNGVTLYSS